MILDLLGESWKTSDFESVLEAFVGGRAVSVSGLKGAARALYLTLLKRHLKLPLTVVTATTKQAEEFQLDLLYFETCFFPDQESRILYFPAHDLEPYQGVGPHPEISMLRMRALWRLSQTSEPVLIVPLEAALQLLPPKEHFGRAYQKLEWTDARGPTEIASVLRGLGHREKDLVASPGEFSLRGGILDFYSPAEPLPVRMEFFGNNVESMRTFDPATQRSVKEVEAATLLAMKEFIPVQSEIDSWGEFSSTRWASSFYHEELADKTEQLLEFGSFEGYEQFAAAFFNRRATILEYLPAGCCLVMDEPVALADAYSRQQAEYRKRYEQVHEVYRIALEPEEMFESWEKLVSDSRKQLSLSLCDFVPEPSPEQFLIEYPFQSGRQFHGQVQEIVQDALRLQETGTTTFFILPTVGKAERLTEILKEYEAPVSFFHSAFEGVGEASLHGRMNVVIGQLSRGFKNPESQVAVLTEDDLFGESRPATQRTPRRAAGAFVSDLRDLKIEDYVVHVDHGIGQFLGLQTMFVDGKEKEFLILSYSEEDKLYVPVERLDLVQKYMGASDAPPRLDRLGSNVWQKTKSKAKASVKEMAEKLLQLYAYRQTVKGHEYPVDDPLQHEFEDAFEYQETAHQMAAIEDVKSDMESDKPMDRLICGDVGYGKTEVAMRAAFKAANNGKQTAILAPTTILVFQHFHTFRKRFEMFPIRIEMVSRFRSRAEIKKTLQETTEGKVDILIGTHRLLSKDVHFLDLGLLIIDEEQRFGVTHKEKLKEMKKNVDALALTATPIPRTLQMALMGFRPLSVIETPPKDRLAIQTNILKYSEDTIAAAIHAELKRGGQVYFVHNRVETIYSIASTIKRLLPEARVAVAHGQMDEKDLEDVMMKFIDHEFDVLVSTTIIENGIDIPLVNTLIVNRADRFGLSQLYQLRGRVGRSHRRAYAYFLIPSEQELTPVARKRLAALREFTDLGSGFRLAALDLEIRGAGNLLGGEQHGHIAALGFELYCRMLEQTVKEMQGQQATPDFSTNLNLNLDLRIPDHYIPNMSQRLSLYKRIATVSSDQQLASVRDEMTDRFGPIPGTVENLLEYGRIKMKAERLKIRSVDRADGNLFLQLNPEGQINVDSVLQFLQKNNGSRLSPAGVLSYPAEKLHVPENLFSTLNTVLDELGRA
jgi:transcription-repair coupling factor (superfamily II helicase)